MSRLPEIEEKMAVLGFLAFPEQEEEDSVARGPSMAWHARGDGGAVCNGG